MFSRTRRGIESIWNEKPEFSIKSCFVIISQQTLFLATKLRRSYEEQNRWKKAVSQD